MLQNKHLKEQMMILIQRVDETIHQNHSHKNSHNNDSVTVDLSTHEDYMPTHQKINKYKEQIASLKAKMEGVYNLRKVEAQENEIKTKKELAHNLKYENNVLNNIQKNQNKAKIQFEQKYENKNEVKQIGEKLRTLKEEFKYSKDLQKSTEAKIKTQNAIILNLEEKCQKIKENIEFKKKEKERNNNEKNNQNNYLNPEEDDLTYLEEKTKFAEIQVMNEEKNYKNEIGKQNNIIGKLSEELSMINITLKEKEQEIRINELKMKELKKINNIQNNNNVNNNMNTNYNRNKSNEIRAISAHMKDGNLNHNRSKSKPMMYMSKTPNHNSRGGNSNKPFSNIKFDNSKTNYNNNYNFNNVGGNISNNKYNNNLPLISDNRVETKEKEEMLNQIENLSKNYFYFF